MACPVPLVKMHCFTAVKNPNVPDAGAVSFDETAGWVLDAKFGYRMGDSLSLRRWVDSPGAVLCLRDEAAVAVAGAEQPGVSINP